jgi:CHAT domain-containing protein
MSTLLSAALAVYAAAGGEGAWSQAFALAERARTGSVQRVVVEAGARAAASTPELADLVRREQDTKWQIEAVSALQLEAASTPSGGDRAAQLAVQLRGLRQAQAAIRNEIGTRFGRYAQLLDPKAADAAALQRALRPDEALVATYAAEDQTYVWAVPSSGAVAFAVVPLGRAKTEAMVRELRAALDPKATTLGEIPAFDTGIAHQLYEALLKPVEAGWAGATDLLVVAQGPLGQIPFDVLVTEPYRVPESRSGEALFSNYQRVPWLARKAAITWLPSVTSLLALRGAAPPPAERVAFAGFGDPWFNPRQAEQAQRQAPAANSAGQVAGRGLPLQRRSVPDGGRAMTYALAQLPRLPDTADEVRSIGAVLGADPERDIFLGARATERRVKTMDLSNRRVVLFATHGLTTGEISGLSQPALALTPPSVSGEPGDGLLTLSDVMALRLNADWVVLSACNTGSADGAGAEAVSGLGRGFFYAGARALLVTHWPVETTSAKALTVDLFRRQAADIGLNRARALRAAKLALIDAPGFMDDRGRVAFSYAHPLFWAPYSLIGDPAGGRPGS